MVSAVRATGEREREREAAISVRERAGTHAKRTNPFHEWCHIRPILFYLFIFYFFFILLGVRQSARRERSQVRHRETRGDDGRDINDIDETAMTA